MGTPLATGALGPDGGLLASAIPPPPPRALPTVSGDGAPRAGGGGGGGGGLRNAVLQCSSARHYPETRMYQWGGGGGPGGLEPKTLAPINPFFSVWSSFFHAVTSECRGEGGPGRSGGGGGCPQGCIRREGTSEAATLAVR